MRTRTLLALSTVLALAIAVPGATPRVALADSSGVLAASGSVVALVQAPLGVRSAGGNTIISYYNAGVVSGTVSGSYQEFGTLIYHPNGTETLQSAITFSGTVGSCGGGTTYFHVSAMGTGGALQGTITSTGQGGEPATHVALAFTQANPFSPVVYSGIYHCS